MMHIIIIIKLQKKFRMFYHLENFAIFFFFENDEDS